MTELGKYLTGRLAHLDITQKLFATQCGVDEAALSRYLQGKQLPMRDIMGRIIRVVGDTEEQKRCLNAYLRDNCPPGYEESIATGTLPATRPLPSVETSPVVLALREVTIPSKAHHAIASIVRAIPHNKPLLDAVLSIGFMALQGTPSLNEAPAQSQSQAKTGKGTASVSNRKRKR